MKEPEIAAGLERRVAAPPAILWALLADSNRVDRVLGAGRVSYRVEGEGVDRQRIGSGRSVGADSTWTERGEWVEGRFFTAERQYLTGMLRRAGFRVDVAPAEGDEADGGTQLRMRAWLEPRDPMPGGGGLLEATTRVALEQYIEGVAVLLARAHFDPADEPLAATLRVRRVLAELEAVGSVVAGKSSPIHEDQWTFCAARFAATLVEAGLRARLLAHLRTRADDELRQIRPFELARAWQLEPREVLGAFLYAARAGLVDLRWEPACPSCRVGVAAVESLSAAAPRAHCDMCAIGFDVDFARNVEAVFHVNPSIRAVDPRPYCGGSPWWRPHVFARFEVPGAARRQATTTLPVSVLVRSERPSAVVAVAVDQGEGGVHVIVDAAGLRAEPAGSDLLVENRTDREVMVSVERAELDTFAVLGVDVMTMPEFHDLFATDAPATGVDLTIGSLAVLFTDLTDTTALYERIGDARAFALVEAHFRRVAQVVRAHRGAVIKTMGDAVMATFAAAPSALAAALEMIQETHATHGMHGLELKAGVHAGPCLAVRANDRLDFFGSTVNLASRLQARAHGGEIVLLDSLMEHPGVTAVVRARELSLERSQVVLKGVSEAQFIVVVRAPR